LPARRQTPPTEYGIPDTHKFVANPGKPGKS
jgi:hypothetical protein